MVDSGNDKKNNVKSFWGEFKKRFIFFLTGSFPGQVEKKTIETITKEPVLGIHPEKKIMTQKAPPVQIIPDTPKKEIIDTDHWWCFAGCEPTEIPVFEILSDDRVVQELNRKLRDDEFPVIEIPENVMKTMEILNKPNFDYNEVIELVKHSPAMVGEFIKVINSSLYSRGIVINDLKAALPRLGRENIKALLYMYSSKMTFSKDMLFNDLAVEIVDHCYATALIASQLAQKFYTDPDAAFLAGLMHDIGKLGILNALAETYELPTSVDFEVSEDLFDDIFPGIHENAGKFLAGHWKVNETIISAIEHHHDFEKYDFALEGETARKLSAIINVSDAMARILGRGRRIEKTNIFELPSAQIIGMQKDNSTVQFIDEIPEHLFLKTQPQ